MEPASLPAFSRELYQEGLIIPPVRLTDEVLTLFVANARNPQERRGDLRAQMAAHRLAERRIDELCARRGRERVVAAMDELYAYSERMVRAAIARLPDGRWSAIGRRRGGRRRPAHPLHRRGARRGDPHRLRRHRGPASGQSQLPARGHAVGLLLRRAVSHGARPAGVRRCVRAGARHRAGGLPRQRACACRRRRGQHGDVVADRRRRLPRVRRSAAGACAGAGDDEQRRARQRPLHVLRDDRRRPGRMPGCRRACPASTLRCRTR